MLSRRVPLLWRGLPACRVVLQASSLRRATGHLPASANSGMLTGVEVPDSYSCMERVGVQIYVSQTSRDRVLIVASITSQAHAACAAAAYDQIAATLCGRGLAIVQERIFASLSVREYVMESRRTAFTAWHVSAEGPATYVQGNPTWGEGFAGLIIHAVSREAISGHVRTIKDDGQPAGRIWRSAKATFAILQNIQGLSADPQADNAPSAQTQRMLEKADHLLASTGLRYEHTVRTWFYLSDILGWYGDFNRVRNEVYSRLKLMPAAGRTELLLPASTGIGGRPPGGAACTMDLIAVAPDEQAGPTIKRLTNSSQKEAFRYGSAFARAALVCEPTGTLVQVSGTAAIDELGQSLHRDDIRAQVRCTLEKMAALLAPQRIRLTDLSAATVFIKCPQHADTARETLAEFGLERFPAVFAIADVCRDELLFEIDAEAVIART